MQEIAAMFNTKRAFILSVLLVGLCYVNSLPNDFVFDDGPIVSSNPAIRAITPIQFLTSPYWTKQQYWGIYRPFTIFSLSIDYRFWKRWAPGFRLTNLAVHAVNGFLVFLLCQSLAGSGVVPLVAMIVYLVHPIHTEAVTSIVGRSELFAACFLFAAWLLFRRGRSVWASGAFFLALLSKENAIVLPAILLLEMWFASPSGRGRREAPGERHGLTENPETLTLTSIEASPYRARGSRPRGRGWLRLAPIIFVSLAYLALRYHVLGGLGIPAAAQYMGGHLSYFSRVITSGRVFIQYLKLIVYPLNVAGDYDFNAIPIARITDWDAWLGLLLVAVLIAFAWYTRHSRPLISFGLLFAMIALAPGSNWIMPISVLMAERFLYLPLLGISLVAAIAYSELKDSRLRRLIGAGGIVTAIILCNSHDYIRRDDFTFFKNMVRVVPDSAKGRLGYGFALIQKGRNDEAADQLEAGLRIIPDFPELLATLALARSTSSSCVQSWPLLNRALEIDPGHADTHRRMGDCYFKEGHIREAEAMYRQAVESIPNPDAMLYFMWGRSLEDIGERTSAEAAYRRAALIDPDNVFIRQKLATADAGRTQD